MFRLLSHLILHFGGNVPTYPYIPLQRGLGFPFHFPCSYPFDSPIRGPMLFYGRRSGMIASRARISEMNCSFFTNIFMTFITIIIRIINIIQLLFNTTITTIIIRFQTKELRDQFATPSLRIKGCNKKAGTAGHSSWGVPLWAIKP